MVALLASVLFPVTLDGAEENNAPDSYPPGDARRCLGNSGQGVNILEVLPGLGWDNLQNTEAGMVLAHNFR